MERFTKRLANGSVGFSGDGTPIENALKLPGALSKLCDFEDTGVEPEDIRKAFNEDAILKLAGQALGITADRIRELAEAENVRLKKPGWISVDDRLPEHSSTFVLALTAPGTLSLGRNCIVADYIHPRDEPTGVFVPAYDYTGDFLTVTHWMPLPDMEGIDNG